MRAFVLPEIGSAPALTELPVPKPGEGEVRVRVHAASINAFDLSVAGGQLAGMMEHRFPVVIGRDFAGFVDAVGDGVSEYAAGDRVFGVVSKPYLGDGSFAQYVIVPTSLGIARLPDGIDFVTGGAIGLAGTAAADSLDAAHLEPGQTVLVAGATGGVGNQVVQQAARAGATVIATAHTDEQRAQVMEFGAREIVDYAGDVVGQVKAQYPDGVDVVIALAGDPGGLIGATRRGGIFVSTILTSPDQVSAEDVEVVAIVATATPETLTRVARDVVEGASKVSVQRTYPLDSVSEALEHFANGKLGKVVVEID